MTLPVLAAARIRGYMPRFVEKPLPGGLYRSSATATGLERERGRARGAGAECLPWLGEGKAAGVSGGLR